MIDAGAEGDNRRFEGIFRRKIDVQVEDTAMEGTVFGAEDHGLPLEQVVGLRGASRTIRWRVAEDFLIFALETSESHLIGSVVWGVRRLAAVGRSSFVGAANGRPLRRWHQLLLCISHRIFDVCGCQCAVIDTEIHQTALEVASQEVFG